MKMCPVFHFEPKAS